MNHSDIQSRMASYLEGELSLDARALFDAHLDQCEVCSQELAEMRETVRLLRNLPTPEPPPDFVTQVMQRIEAGDGQPGWFGRLLDSLGQLLVPRFVIPATAVAAGLTLTLTFDQLDLPGLDLRTRVAQPEVAGIRGAEARLPAANRLTTGSQQVAQRPPPVRVARVETLHRMSPTPPLRSRSQSGAGPFLYRVNNHQLGPMRRQAGEPAFASRVFAMNRAPQQIGPYLGASAAPSIALGTGPLRATPQQAPGTASSGRLVPVAVSHFDPLAAVDDALTPAQRRTRELDARLRFLTRDPTGFAQQQARSSLAERELWMRQIAERATELEDVARVISALTGSGDPAGVGLVREFEVALKAIRQNRDAWAAADAAGEAE